MPPKAPTLYSTHKTTIWFAIASIALFVGLVVMVFQDSTREWKHYQHKFIRYNKEKTERELHAAQKALNEKELARLESELEDSRRKASARQKEIRDLQEKLAPLGVGVTVANSRFQDLKQQQDSDRYYFELYREEGKQDKAAHYEERLKERAADLDAARLKMEAAQAKEEGVQDEIKAIRADEKKIDLEIKRMLSDVTRLKSKLAKIEPGWVDAVLNAPMLDFIHPTLQIQQIVVEDIYDDYFFTYVQKVDRCVTCHLGIDQAGFSAEGGEDIPPVFRAHPKLDLFVGQNSPHPMEEFGCTSCHGGSGHSLSFFTAAHTPSSEKQAEEWEKEHHWHPMKHWAEKMLPMNHIEAACAKCHQGETWVPEAPKLNEGRKLAQTFGCFGCHKVEGYSAGGGEDAWKVGPSLLHVQSKLEQDWIVRWLHNPKEFRASTKMPRIFHLDNTADPASRETSDAMIASIATYLVRNSEPVSLQTPPKQGRAEAGGRLIEELGCLGCHTAAGKDANDHGPELTGLGSKVNADWLYTWLKDPKHYAPDTRMPNLRLSDQEAADITAFLLADKNEKFESLKPPLVKPETVDELALMFLTGNMRVQDAKNKINGMTPEEKLNFVGEKTIARQGCFGCHDIKGFEDAKPIGTELTEEGSKDIHRLDFGFIDIPHTRQDWFFTKLKNPRVFDEGKDKPYNDKLRMPHFGFTDEQAERLTTFLLSLQRAEIPLEKQNRLDLNEQKIEEGRMLAAKLNCQGCHTLDGREGAVRRLFEDAGNAPPILDGEGAKVQPDWLYEFLKDPAAIRPWLKYRMPTFEFSDEELATLVQYFIHLSHMPPSFAVDHAPQVTSGQMQVGRSLFKSFQCIKCHKSNPDPGLSASFLAPDLVMAKHRLRPEWMVDWLRDPQALMPGTMMPGFFPDGETPVQDVLGGDADKQMKAIRDYLWNFDAQEAQSVQGGVT